MCKNFDVMWSPQTEKQQQYFVKRGIEFIELVQGLVLFLILKTYYNSDKLKINTTITYLSDIYSPVPRHHT